MKVSGIRLREAMRKWNTRLEVASKQFKTSLWQFKNDNRKLPSPTQLSARFQEADKAIAAIQVAQQKFNLDCSVVVAGQSMSLAMAVKLIGNAGRHEKMWRSAAADDGNDRYTRDNIRKADEIHAERQVSVEDSLSAAEAAAEYASSLRAAIATANARELEVDIDPKYLD